MKEIPKVLQKLGYGIYVVTAGKGVEGNAFTASWVTQVSSDPYMLALAVKNDHQSAGMIQDNGAFVVNLIDKDQEGVAKTYFGPAESGYDRLAGRTLVDSPATGTPLLAGSMGYLDCKVVNSVATGNHTLFIGEIMAASLEHDRGQVLATVNTKLHYTG